MKEHEQPDLDALDNLASYYDMPQAHSLQGSLPIHHTNPEGIRLIKAGGTFRMRGHDYEIENQVIEPRRHVRATNWLKSLIRH
jgi:hypothetical protein